MKRICYKKLILWKESGHRMPLILMGARQVGKSFLLREFGKNEYADFHLFDFEKNQGELSEIFSGNLSAQRLFNELALLGGRPINPKTDLVIFDEIQNCPRALTSLKYFNEEMPELSICCAGSLLGVKLADASFPVGKINFLDLHPMNFEEFLLALEEHQLLATLDHLKDCKTIPSVAHHRLWELLKVYYVVGGMPKSVETYREHRDNQFMALLESRIVQGEIVRAYKRDFSKHSGKTNSLHIGRVLDSIPQQLSQNLDASVRRYQFKDVIPNKKGFGAFEGPIDWLEKAGLVLKVRICNRPEIPFKAFCKENIFKLFIFDIGILGSLLDLKPEVVIRHDYGITKGFFAENFVAQEFTASGLTGLYSWVHKNSEIEFILDHAGEVFPVEVKAGSRTKAQSLKQYLSLYHPTRAIKISSNNLHLDSLPSLVPLYLSGRIKSLLSL